MTIEELVSLRKKLIAIHEENKILDSTISTLQDRIKELQEHVSGLYKLNQQYYEEKNEAVLKYVQLQEAYNELERKLEKQ